MFVLLLCTTSCKTSEKRILSKNQQQTNYIVSNLKEFLDALGNNRKITLTNEISIKEELKSVVTDTSKFFDSFPTNKRWFSPIYVNEFDDIIGPYTSSVRTKD